MGTKNRKWASQLAAAVVFAAGGRALAQTVGEPINPSFQNPATGGFIDDFNAQIDNPSNATFWGWGYFFNTSGPTADRDAGVQANTNAGLTGNADDNSSQNGWVNGAGDYLYQDIGQLSPNTTYSATVGLAAPGGTAYGGVGGGNNQPTSEIDLLNGTQTVSGTTDNVPTNGTLLAGSGVLTPPNGTFQDFTVSYTTGSSVSGDLIIQLMEDTLGPHEQGVFDDVVVKINGVLPPPAPAVWSPNASGDWNSGGNWSTGLVPNAAGAEADLFSAITAAHTVFTDAPITVGIINFNNANTYEITGTGNLTLQSGTTAQVIVQAGIQEIDLPTTIASNTTFNVAAGSTLLIANPLTVAAGKTVTQTGGGAVTYQSLVTLQSGASLSFGNSTTANTLTLATGGASAVITSTTGAPSVLQVNNLNIGAGSSLNLANNSLIVNFGSAADPAATIRGYLISGYNSVGGSAGNWQGTGITSSSAAANPSAFSVGYADGGYASDRANTAVPAGRVEVMYTVAGDANLSGGVDLSDLVIVASDFGETGADRAQGDVNYDGNVDLSDLVIVASNFGASLSSVQTSDFRGSFAAEWQLAQAEVHGADVQVPEPATGSLAIISVASLLVRRRARLAQACRT